MATFAYSHSFTPNTAAKSTEVNSNFNAVKTFVEGISTGANIDGGAITEGKIYAGAVTATKIANGAISNDKIDYTSVPRITVSTTEPSSTKAGDVWVQI